MKKVNAEGVSPPIPGSILGKKKVTIYIDEKVYLKFRTKCKRRVSEAIENAICEHYSIKKPKHY